MTIIAQLGGSGMVHDLLVALLVGLAILAIWYVGTWFIGRLGGPPMVRTVWDGIFILVGLICVVNFLMGLAGRPIFPW